jgi:hypothetical protein
LLAALLVAEVAVVEVVPVDDLVAELVQLLAALGSDSVVAVQLLAQETWYH